jgi:tripeptide aminopeptidase
VTDRTFSTLAVSRLHAALASARSRLAAADAQILATQVALTEIPAPTGDEGARAAVVAQRFRALGLEGVTIDSVGNVIGRRPGATDTPAVALCAHLDTVFPREAVSQVSRDQGRLIAPGIGDNGRGLATLLALAEVIDGVSLRTLRPVTFVATTGEEGVGDLRGAKSFFADTAPLFAAIALDGTGDDRIIHKGVGSRRFRVTWDGPGGHSWSDFGGVNPIHAAAQAMAQLSALPLANSPRTTLTVSRMGGGLAINAIPHQAWFEVDVRCTAAEPLARIEATLRSIVTSALRDANTRRAQYSEPVEATIAVIGDRPCGELPEDHPLVEAAVTATRLIGRVPEFAMASTDANVPLSLGIPAIAIGGGGVGGDVHTLGEWYENTDGARGIARALTITMAAAGHDG